MSKKAFVALALLTFVALVLGALPVAAQEPVTITWFVGLGAGGQPEQQEIQNQVVQQFNDTHDDIELEIVIVENNVASDTLATLIASGDAPDIIGPVGTEGSNTFAGQYLDLQPLVDAAGYDLSQFDEAAVNSYRVEGEGLLGIPFAVFPSFIYYRTDLFDEAGLEYPPAEYGAPYVLDGEEVEWNWDTLREVAMILTVDANGNDATMEEFDPENIVQWGFNWQWNEPRGIGTAFGACALVDEEGNATICDNWRDAWTWWYNGMWEDNFIPTAAQAGSDYLAQGNSFSSGYVAMAYTHLWYTCCIGEATNWNIAAVPTHNGVATAKLHGDTFRILEATDNPEEAFEVLTYLIGEAAPQLLQAYGGLPARAEQQEAFFATLDERYPQGVNWQVAIDSLAYADSPNHESAMPNHAQSRDVVGAFQTLIEGDGTLDIAAEIDRLVEELQAAYDAAES